MKSLWAVVIMFWFVSSWAQAQDNSEKAPPPIVDAPMVAPDAAEDSTEPPAQPPVVDIRPQRRHDHPFALVGQASFIGLAVPTKFGLGYTYRMSPHWAIEPSFFNGSYSISSHWLDIGSFNESLWMLNFRLYVFHSFSFVFGLTRQNYVAHIGNSILSSAGLYQQGADLINVTTMGIQLGVGNRWVYRRLVFGVDWLTLNIPFHTIEDDAPALNLINNSTVLSDLDGAVKIMRYLPTGSLLKFALGFSF